MRTFGRTDRPPIPSRESMSQHLETVMSLARCVTALLVAAALGGCASLGAGAPRATPASESISAAEELALLRLAEKVERAALEADVLQYAQ